MQIKKLISNIELNPLSKRWEWILLSICLLTATAILIYSTWDGLIWTSDSFHYWAASRSWQNDLTLEAADGGSYLFWPPLYPVLLSLFASENSYYIAHIIIFNASLLFIYAFLQKKSRSKKITLIALFTFSISVFPYLVASFLWSETFFVLLMYAGLYFYAHWEENKNPVYVALWVILMAAMCLQRNSGVFILIGLSIYALLQFISNKNQKAFIINAVGIFVAIIPAAIWNFSTIVKSSETVAKENISFFNAVFVNLENILIKLFHFLLPAQQLEITGFIAVTFIVLIFLILIFRFKHPLLVTLLLSYVLLFSFVPRIEPESIDRFLAPVFPLFIFLLLFLLEKIIFSGNRFIKFIAVTYLILFFSYNILRTYKNVKMWHERSITNPKDAKIFF